MKKIALLMATLIISGCCTVPPQALEQIGTNAIISDAYIVLMEKGETNSDQDQAFIHANRRNWHALNFATNETVLPEDMQDDFDGNLLETLEKDPKIRAMVNKVRDAITPDAPDTDDTDTDDGN